MTYGSLTNCLRRIGSSCRGIIGMEVLNQGIVQYGLESLFVRCADNSLYCGITNDISGRNKKHNAGKGAKYTKSRLPVKLMAVSKGLSKRNALRLERYTKRQPAREKVSAIKCRA